MRKAKSSSPTEASGSRNCLRLHLLNMNLNPCPAGLGKKFSSWPALILSSFREDAEKCPARALWLCGRVRRVLSRRSRPAGAPLWVFSVARKLTTCCPANPESPRRGTWRCAPTPLVSREPASHRKALGRSCESAFRLSPQSSVSPRVRSRLWKNLKLLWKSNYVNPIAHRQNIIRRACG
jgi:hypothetical protein